VTIRQLDRTSPEASRANGTKPRLLSGAARKNGARATDLSEPDRANSLKPETIAAQGGGGVDPATGAIVPPIHIATTFVRDAGCASGSRFHSADAGPDPTSDARRRHCAAFGDQVSQRPLRRHRRGHRVCPRRACLRERRAPTLEVGCNPGLIRGGPASAGLAHFAPPRAPSIGRCHGYRQPFHRAPFSRAGALSRVSFASGPCDRSTPDAGRVRRR
jgi:hypothetical protein